MVNFEEVENIFNGGSHNAEKQLVEILKSQGNVTKIEDQDDSLCVFYSGKVDDFSCVREELHKLKVVMSGFRHILNNKTHLVWFCNL